MLSSQFDLFEKGKIVSLSLCACVVIRVEWDIGSIFVGQMKSLLGNGVFNSDGTFNCS